MNPLKRVAPPRILLGLLLCVGWTLGSAGVRAQEAPPPDDGYQVQENADAAPSVQDSAENGPVRLARFTYVQGNVTWRGDESLEWSRASINLPVRQGAQIYVAEDSRAELQFDDGSFLRLGTGALATLQTLHSDADGEYTEIKLNDGLASLDLRDRPAAYQIDTPFVSVNARGPAKLRVGVGQTVEVAVEQGQARLEGRQGETTLNGDDYVELRDADAPFEITRAPDPDNWDEWNRERDRKWQEAEAGPSSRNLPPDIAIVGDDLDAYGTWHDDPHYGEVWCPRVHSSDWRPYGDGHWTWVNPFGWTWVSDEPWGWAPYHYGTWVSLSYGWAWVPGPAHQYWCPAVVNFCEDNGRVAWCPLAPEEVRYPTRLAIGFRGGDWSLFFSIGQAGVYYPTARGYCEARPWNSAYVNHVTYINHVTNIYNGNGRRDNPSFDRFRNSREFYAANHNTTLQSAPFVPRNARAAGVTLASASAFGGHGSYEAAPRSEAAAIFAHGQVVSAPSAGHAPLAGPPAVRPGLNALTPNRTFVQNMRPSSAMLSRPVFQSASARARPMTPTGTFTNRTNTFTRTRQPAASSDRVATGMETHGRQITGSSFNRENRVPTFGESTARASRPAWNADRNVSSLSNRERNGEASRPPLGSSYRNARSESTQETIAEARASLGLPYHGRVPDGFSTNRAGSRIDSSARRAPQTFDPAASSRHDYIYGRENRSGFQRSDPSASGRSDPFTYRQVYSAPRQDSSASRRQDSPAYGRENRPSYRQNTETGARQYGSSASGRGDSSYSAQRYQQRSYEQRSYDQRSYQQRSYEPPRRPSYSYQAPQRSYSRGSYSGGRDYAPARREASSAGGRSSERSSSGGGGSDRGSRSRR